MVARYNSARAAEAATRAAKDDRRRGIGNWRGREREGRKKKDGEREVKCAIWARTSVTAEGKDSATLIRGSVRSDSPTPGGPPRRPRPGGSRATGAAKEREEVTQFRLNRLIVVTSPQSSDKDGVADLADADANASRHFANTSCRILGIPWAKASRLL